MAAITDLATLGSGAIADTDYLVVNDSGTDKKITYVDLMGVKGSWTPNLTASSGSGTISSFGQYRVIMDVVFCWFELSVTSVGTLSGDLFISGLPYAINAGLSLANAAVEIDGVTKPANTSVITWQASASQTYVRLIASGGTAANAALQASAIANGTTIRGLIIYVK